jgi:lactose/L-arabinose transport system substrate-binding protein
LSVDFDFNPINTQKEKNTMLRKSTLKSMLPVLALGTILLGACTSAATPAATTVPSTPVIQQVVVTATGEVQPTATPQPKGKIVLWGWSYDVFKTPGLIDDFQKQFPGIQVEIVTYSAGDTYQKLQLALTSGQGAPDVVQIENSHLAGFVELGGLSDMTAQVTPYLDKINAYKWNDAVKGGKYYAMPWDSGPVVMYYRRDVFKAAGLDTDPDKVSALVSTWDGYLSVCKTVKEKTGLNCFANDKSTNNARLYEMALWQQGLGYYDKDGKVTVDSPEDIATLEKLGEFWTADVTSFDQAWTDPWYASLNSSLTSTTKPVATIVEASWLGVFLKTWIAGGTAGNWGVAYMPAMKAGQVRAANDGGSTLAIPEQSQNKAAAWAFIEFMLGNRENQLKSFAYCDFLPSLETTYDDALLTEPDSFFGGEVARKIYLDVAKQIPTAYIYGPKYTQMNGFVSTAIQKYASGSMSAADALKEAATQIRQQTGMQ